MRLRWEIGLALRRGSRSGSSSVWVYLFHLLLVALLLSWQSPASSAEEVFLSITLYDHQNKEGPSKNVDVKGCTNLEADWNDRTSSFELHGRCIKLYKDQDCTGRVVTVRLNRETGVDEGWLGNLKKLHMNDAISSVSSCSRESPQIGNGRYVLQSPFDRHVLTVRRLVGGYTMLKTERWIKGFSQQWDVEVNDDGTIWLTPRVYETNRITYDMKPSDTAVTAVEKNNWIIEGLSGKVYSIRKDGTNNCVTMGGRMEVKLRFCNRENVQQHWVFHKMKNSVEERRRRRIY